MLESRSFMLCRQGRQATPFTLDIVNVITKTRAATNRRITAIPRAVTRKNRGATHKASLLLSSPVNQRQVRRPRKRVLTRSAPLKTRESLTARYGTVQYLKRGST